MNSIKEQNDLTVSLRDLEKTVREHIVYILNLKLVVKEDYKGNRKKRRYIIYQSPYLVDIQKWLVCKIENYFLNTTQFKQLRSIQS